MQSLSECRLLEKRPRFISGRDPNPRKETTINLQGSLEAPLLPCISTRIWMVPPPPLAWCSCLLPASVRWVSDFGLPSCLSQVNRSSASVSKIKSLQEKKKKSMLVKLSHLILKATWNSDFSYLLCCFLPLDVLQFCLFAFDVLSRSSSFGQLQ